MHAYKMLPNVNKENPQLWIPLIVHQVHGAFIYYVQTTSGLKLSLYVVRFGRFWKNFLHHTYKMRFSLITNHTSPIEGKNWSTQGVVHSIGSVQLVQLYVFFF